jgi:hypothetical protein
VKYYHNEELTSLIVLLTTSLFRLEGRNYSKYLYSCSINDTVRELLRLTEESISLDRDTFSGLDLLRSGGGSFIHTHYQYLFARSASNTFAGDLDGNKYAGTALKILKFLCAHSPRPLRWYRYHPRQQKTSEPSSCPGVSTRSTILKSSRMAPHKGTYCRFLRKLRVEKYRCGVILSLPRTEKKYCGYKTIPCEVGLRILPEILERSSRSAELVNFIRTHGKDIAFLPNLTRKAIRAMHEYLDRPDDDVAME